MKYFWLSSAVLMIGLRLSFAYATIPSKTFEEFKATEIQLIKAELAIAQHKPADTVNILDFMVGRWGFWEEPLFTDAFFVKSYEYYLMEPDGTLFERAKTNYKKSHTPQLEFYPALFAMRVMNAEPRAADFQARVLQFLSDGEGIINMGGCCGDFVTAFLHGIEKQMVMTAWEQAWLDPSRVVLDTVVSISRKFAIGTHFYPKWLINEKIFDLKKSPVPENLRRLGEIIAKEESYLDGDYAKDDFALSELIDQLSRLGVGDTNFRSHLISFLVPGPRFATIESSADALAILPNLERDSVEKMLTIVSNPHTLARTYFHLTEHTFALVLQNQLGYQTRLMEFYKANPDVLDHPFYILAQFGFVGLLESSVRDELLRLFAGGTPIAQKGAAFALGAATVQPQRVEYHYALVDEIFAPDDLYRDLARTLLRMYYADDPEALRLLADPSDPSAVDRLREIVKNRFAGSLGSLSK